MPKADLGDVVINYRQVGEGPEPIVLVHGLAANMAFWNLKLQSALARRCRVVSYDLRGHGYSSMPERGYSPASLAGDLIALLDSLGIERAHLVGHSFGGTIALNAAAAAPDRVSSLTLVDTRLKALQPNQRLVDWPHWQEAKRMLESLDLEVDELEEDIGLNLLEQVAEPRWKETRERLAKKALFVPFGGWSSGNRAAERFIRLLRETESRAHFQGPDGLPIERLYSIQKPVLAIYGANSRCMATANRIRELWPHCRLCVVPGAGHYFPAVRPDAVSDPILEFLPALEPVVPHREAGDAVPAEERG
jgi:pimeloyl-ACP methyl ester carboxylesterase